MLNTLLKSYTSNTYSSICSNYKFKFRSICTRTKSKKFKKLFGLDCFKEVICLDTGADKDEILLEFGKKYPGAYWIEDKP